MDKDSQTDVQVTIVVGGRWHAFDLARELHALGALHRIVTNYPRFKVREWGVPDDRVSCLLGPGILGRLVDRFPLKRFARQIQARAHDWFASSAARRLGEPNLVHAWSSFAEPSISWADSRGIPTVLERSSSHILTQIRILSEEYLHHGLTWKPPHPSIVQRELREYNGATRIAVPSGFVRDSFIQEGTPGERLFLSPFGTNLRAFRPSESQPIDFHVVYAGALSVRKGIRYLLKAFTEAEGPVKGLHLLGTHTSETPLLLEGMPSSVRAPGHVPQASLLDYYHHASVFVMPSVEEGLAVVQAQAMACGLPLICTSHSGGEDLLATENEAPTLLPGNIREYPAGFVVPIRDSGAITHCLKLLACNPQMLRAKRAAALRIRSQRLGWETYAARNRSLYLKLINSQSIR